MTKYRYENECVRELISLVPGEVILLYDLILKLL